MSEMGARVGMEVEAEVTPGNGGVLLTATPLSLNPLSGIGLLLHKKFSPAPDVGGPNTIMVSDWNDTHIFGGGVTGYGLLRDGASPDGARWSSFTLAKFLLAEAHPDLPQGQTLVTGPGLSYSLGALTIADNGISNAMLRDSHGQSVIGRAGSAGDPEDIIATLEGTVLRRYGGVLAFGALDLGDSSTFTGILPASKMDPAYPATIADNAVTDAKLRDSVGLSVIGRAATGIGDPGDIVAGTDGYVLRRSGTTLAFGTLDLAGPSLTGTLPVTAGGVPPGGADGQVLTKVSGSPAWAAPTGGGGGGLPAGGAPGTVLVKNTITNGDAGWKDDLTLDLLGITGSATLNNDKGLWGKYKDGTPHFLIGVTDDTPEWVWIGDAGVLQLGMGSGAAGSRVDIWGEVVYLQAPNTQLTGNLLVDGATYTGYEVKVGVRKQDQNNFLEVTTDSTHTPNLILHKAGIRAWNASIDSSGSANLVLRGTYDLSGPVLFTFGGDGSLDVSERLRLPNTKAVWSKMAGGTDVPILYVSSGDLTIVGAAAVPVYMPGALQLATPLGQNYGGTGIATWGLGAVLVGKADGTAMLVGGGTEGQVLTIDGTSPAGVYWKAAAGGTPADNSITNAKLRDSVGLSVIGRSANTTGDPADIAAAADGNVLRRSGTTLGFGAINLAAGSAAIAGALTPINGGTGYAYGGVGWGDILVGDFTNNRFIALARGSEGQILVTRGAATYMVQWEDNNVFPGICEGRLTTQSGTPVSTADRLAQSLVYFTPYRGNRIALYESSRWVYYALTELVLDLTANTLSSGRPADVFVYSTGGALPLIIERVNWSSATARTTALVSQDGIWVKSGATNRRYVGTIFPATTTTVEDSAAKRYVWNAQNRVRRHMQAALETANSWNYTLATWRQANANAANQLDYVVGVIEDIVRAHAACAASNTSAATAAVGIGNDVTNANSGHIMGGGVAPTTGVIPQLHSEFVGYPPGIGKRFLAWLEIAAATGTCTFYGDNNLPTYFQAGIYGEVFA